MKKKVLGKFGGHRIGGKSYDAEGKEFAEEHERDCFCCRPNALTPMSHDTQGWRKAFDELCEGNYLSRAEVDREIVAGFIAQVESEAYEKAERAVSVLLIETDPEVDGSHLKNFRRGWNAAARSFKEHLRSLKSSPQE